MISHVNLSECIGPAFHDLHGSIVDNEYDSYWLQGGRGSLKSSFAAIEIIQGIMRDPKANGIVFRKVGDTIKDSVLSTLEWAIEKCNVAHLWRVTSSPARMVYKPTGQQILFKGLDNPLKIKSIKVKRGYLKYHWYEEAAEFAGPAELRSVRQSVARGGKLFVEFVTFNPPPDPNHWINKEALLTKKGRIVHHSDYTKVPPEWLGPIFLEDAEWLKENNPIAYQNEYLGIAVGTSEAIIFAGHYRVAEFTPKPEWDGPYFGGDFGFAKDPATLVKVWIEEFDTGKKRTDPETRELVPRMAERLYIEYAAFGKAVELDDYPEFYDEVPGSRDHRIKADSSAPATISHIRRKGFDIRGAEKWPGSIEEGITVLLGFAEIVIHTRCTHMQEEARLYSYKIDRLTKEVLADIVDKFNHGWDAVRYALDKYIKRKSMGFFARPTGTPAPTETTEPKEPGTPPHVEQLPPPPPADPAVPEIINGIKIIY